MEISFKSISMRPIGVFVVVATTLAAGLAVSAAPSQQASSSNLASIATTTSGSTTTTTTTTTPSSSPASKPPPHAPQSTQKPTSHSTNAANLQHQPQQQQLQSSLPTVYSDYNPDGAKSGIGSSSSSANDELSTFDGKNPFSDDSLWQIPIHLVRELGPSEPSRTTLGRSYSDNDMMAKSASKVASADEPDDYLADMAEDGRAAFGPTQSSSSSSPTVISASTDLKTAAGYHHPTHGGYHHGASHHDGGGHHDAGHYGGGDHYGKYFQYASVPYPYAWDFGYRRGNPYHTIERYEHGKGPHFQTKVKWSDKHGGYGVHVWDYNHDDHHSHHYEPSHHGGYDSHGPSHYGHGGSHHGAHYGGHH